jgi:hypothetical protein
MKYIYFYFILFYPLFFISCSDSSNPSNNSTVTKDSLIFSYDSLSIWSSTPNFNIIGKSFTDSTIKQVKIFFGGECDIDSSYVEMFVNSAGGVFFDYKKQGQISVNVDHAIDVNLLGYPYYCFNFKVCLFSNLMTGMHHVKMKWIKIFSVKY